MSGAIETVPKEILKQYPDYKLIISGNSMKLACIIANPEFTTSVSVQTSNMAGDVGSLVGAFSSKAKGFVDAITSANDKSALSPYMSLKRWKGSQNNDFSVEFYVLENGRLVDRALNTMVLPKVVNGLYVYEPMSLTGAMMDLISGGADGLDKFMAKQKAKLFTVKVGSWFHAKYLFCTSVTVNRKINVKVDGRPAYMRVQMQFEPIMDLTREELNSWFLK